MSKSRKSIDNFANRVAVAPAYSAHDLGVYGLRKVGGRRLRTDMEIIMVDASKRRLLVKALRKLAESK